MGKERRQGPDRRKYPRINRMLDGNWKTGSVSSACRISDISLGGCFVQGMAAPAVGERLVVTVNAGSESFSLPAVVRSVEAAIGFSVEFQDVPYDAGEALTRLVESLEVAG